MKIEKKFRIIGVTTFIFLLIALSFVYFISSSIVERTDSLLFSFGLSACIIALGMVIMSIYISKKLIRPLNDIYNFSSEIIDKESFNKKIYVKTGDELENISNNFNRMAELLQARINMLSTASDKEQNIIRTLTMLTEMMGFIPSELKLETILQTLLEMTRSLLKAEHSGIFIFEGEKKEFKLFKSTIENETSVECSKTMLQGALGDAMRGLTTFRINEFKTPLPSDHIAIKNLIAITLASAGDRMSALLVAVNKKDYFTQDDEDTLFNFAFQAFQALTIHEEIARLAVTDGLTGLGNHRAFQEKLSEEIERASRYAKVLSVVMLDIDHFKSFNDVYGHQSGDNALKQIAMIINSSMRNVDFSARYGGEEFIVILPETGCEEAVAVAERIRRRVNEYQFATENKTKAVLTISSGIACYPYDALTKEDLLKKADQALYFAKEHGRNKVYFYQETIVGVLKEIPEELDNILKDPALKGIEAVAKGIDSKSYYTKGHSLEVAAYAVMLGRQIQISEEQIEGLKIASLLHDIGNIAIPERILNKPGPLTAEEKSIIQGHPGLGEMVLKKYPHIEDIVPAILYHHERFDGKGYPLGLKGEDIPLLARILAVVEAYQAMLSPRPYRMRMTREEAIENLKRDAGSQFDPMVVNAFVESLRQK